MLPVLMIMRMVVTVEMMRVVDMLVASIFSSVRAIGLFRSSVVSVFRFFRSIIVDVSYPEFMWSVV